MQLGDTRVFAVANGELVSYDWLRVTLHRTRVCLGRVALTGFPCSQAAPFPDRPSEGQFALGVEFSPMASPEFEPGRGTDAAVELSRFLERGLKQSGTFGHFNVWTTCNSQKRALSCGSQGLLTWKR